MNAKCKSNIPLLFGFPPGELMGGKERRGLFLALALCIAYTPSLPVFLAFTTQTYV